MRGRALLLLSLLLLTACAPPTLIPTPTAPTASATPQTLRLLYAESLAPLARDLSARYRQSHPDVRIILIERADALAWPTLESGAADAALVTWLDPDLPAVAWSRPFARDGLAVVVHPQNGLPGLTLEQTRLLFQGRVEDWAPWGGLPGLPELVSREEASGDARLFRERVMGDFPVALTAYLAPDSETVLDLVAQRPLAVGYLSSARVDGRVRALALESVPPVPETIASGLYPLTRDLFFLSEGEPSGAVRPFAEWLLGAEGQTQVEASGWIPNAP